MMLQPWAAGDPGREGPAFLNSLAVVGLRGDWSFADMMGKEMRNI
jgi:hypothetical protein